MEDGHWQTISFGLLTVLVAIGMLEIGKQTLGNMKRKRRTEKQRGWRDRFVLAMGGVRSDGCILAESRRGRGFRVQETRFREVLDGALGPVEMGDLQHLC